MATATTTTTTSKSKKDSEKRSTVSAPLLTINASPRDEDWPARLKEEYTSLIQYISKNKEDGNDWFKIESDPDGKKWNGKCWHTQNYTKYEFSFEFSIPSAYPNSAPEILIPELEGKTAKMYKGGKICLTDHFFPLWARNTPKYGISHLLIFGLSPWIAVEIPDMIEKGIIYK